jgi:excisionase family DNA binding protein
MTKQPHRVVFTVREAATVLRIRRSKVYELIKTGLIEGFKVGADWRIKRESLERLVGPIPDDFFGANSDTLDKNPANGADPLKMAS